MFWMIPYQLNRPVLGSHHCILAIGLLYTHSHLLCFSPQRGFSSPRKELFNSPEPFSSRLPSYNSPDRLPSYNSQAQDETFAEESDEECGIPISHRHGSPTGKQGSDLMAAKKSRQNRWQLLSDDLSPATANVFICSFDSHFDSFSSFSNTLKLTE